MVSRESNPRKWREQVFIDTERRAPSYHYSNSIRVTSSPILIIPKPLSKTIIEVSNSDSIDAAKQLLDSGYNPLILNFANDHHAGGGVASGAGAQEESLWRRTNLCETQVQILYPLRSTPPEGIYTEKATVFKSKESEGCTLLAEPFQASFLAVPAIHNPKLDSHGRFSENDERIFRNKVELIFQTAFHKSHDSLVLGPFGCGAWNCPPQHVAEIFRSVCKTYNCIFKKIVFACYIVEGTSSSYRNQSALNFEIFNHVLSS
jgi:uncharacterized protein (TIGR02452 family)